MIDVVITWVDGNDPIHSQKIDRAKNTANKANTTIKAGLHSTRFSDNREIDLCISSLENFTPWVRKIYIITDNQDPKLAKTQFVRDKVEVIDHTHIFRGYEWALPTFNSRSIETMLWRIEGLSDKFIYLNDDFIILNPFNENDFFVNGFPVIQGKWQTYYPPDSFYYKATDPLIDFLKRKILHTQRTYHLRAQFMGAHLLGIKGSFFKVPHIPHPMKRSVLEHLFSSKNELLENNIKYTFRDKSQFWPISLYNHYEISHNNAILKNSVKSTILNLESNGTRTLRKVENDIFEGSIDFISLAGLETCKESEVSRLYSVLKQAITSRSR